MKNKETEKIYKSKNYRKIKKNIKIEHWNTKQIKEYKYKVITK